MTKKEEFVGELVQAQCDINKGYSFCGDKLDVYKDALVLEFTSTMAKITNFNFPDYDIVITNDELERCFPPEKGE